MKLYADRSVKAKAFECDGEYSLEITFPDGAIKLYPRVTSDAEGIRLLAERINGGRVSEVHIDDIIEDFLG